MSPIRKPVGLLCHTATCHHILWYIVVYYAVLCYTIIYYHILSYTIIYWNILFYRRAQRLKGRPRGHSSSCRGPHGSLADPGSWPVRMQMSEPKSLTIWGLGGGGIRSRNLWKELSELVGVTSSAPIVLSLLQAPTRPEVARAFSSTLQWWKVWGELRAYNGADNTSQSSTIEQQVIRYHITQYKLI